MANQTKITYILFAVLFVAIGFLFYQNNKLEIALRSGSPSQAQTGLAPNASTTAALASVTVGSLPTTDNIAGTITTLGGNTLQIKDINTGNIDSVSISSKTVIQIAGKIKDAVTQQKELAAYNAQVALLMNDPIKNKTALAAMQLPPTQEITPGNLSDLAVGDQVLLAASGVNSNDVYEAVSITKSTVNAGPVQ
jgi:hypothetical protein